MENQGSQGERRNQNQCFKQGTFQQQQQLYPSSQERISKLEDTLERFMQTTFSNQKNFEDLETQLGQIAQQLKKSRGQCKSVSTRNGIVVGKGISGNLIVEKERKIEIEEEKKEKKKKRGYRKKKNERKMRIEKRVLHF